MSAPRLKKRRESILAVLKTTELVVKIRPEKSQVRTGFEPTISYRPELSQALSQLLVQ